MDSVAKRTADLITNNTLIMYLLIGGCAAAIDLGAFLFLHELGGISALLSHSLSVCLSAIFSFTANAWLNFKKTDHLLFRFTSFSLVVFAGYLLGALIISLTEYLGGSGTLGKVLSLPAVALFQYFLNAKISFRSK